MKDIFEVNSGAWKVLAVSLFAGIAVLVILV
jgi:hypothetical protein